MIVISGGGGRLGEAIGRVIPTALRPTRAEFDVTDPATMRAYLERLSYPPSYFIHAAAMTNVRVAETERDRCWAVNVRGTENLVGALQEFSPACSFVYISTACVFDGNVGDYTESDVPNPKNFYGLTKLVGEFVAKQMRTHLIVRTNFVARDKWPFDRAFVDRFGTYLFADDVALGLKDLMAARHQGLVHLAGDRKLSMYELARMTRDDVGTMTLADVDIPLTANMSLRSTRIATRRIGELLPST